MFTAISLVKLFGLIFFWMAIFTGLGWLFIGPVIHHSFFQKSNFPNLLQDLPTSMIAGMIMNYGITLIFQKLQISLIVSSVLGLIGFVFFVFWYFRSTKGQKILQSTVFQWVSIIFINLFFLGPILVNPLYEWDARSIWFLHAKMIYVAQTFGLAAGWQNPILQFSHLDYPNLIPALAAQIANMMGYWNEYLPKLSLIFCLIPAVMIIFSFMKKSFSFIFLLLLIPFSINITLWDGYMDGYLTIYIALGILLFGRYLKNYKTPDLYSSLLCFIFVVYLKNEGMFGILCGVLTIGVFLWINREKIRGVKHFPNLLKWGVLFVSLVPAIIWIFYKNLWNLKNDLSIGSADSISRGLQRLTDGSLLQIWKACFPQIETALVILSLVVITSMIWKRNTSISCSPAFIFAGLYLTGMILIYLVTPHDLTWHLANSIDRTLMPVSFSIYIGCYFILNDLFEENLNEEF